MIQYRAPAVNRFVEVRPARRKGSPDRPSMVIVAIRLLLRENGALGDGLVPGAKRRPAHAAVLEEVKRLAKSLSDGQAELPIRRRRIWRLLAYVLPIDLLGEPFQVRGSCS